MASRKGSVFPEARPGRTSASLNTGVSSTRRRIHRPTRTSSEESRNGMRQPYCMNALSGPASSPAARVKARNVPEDSRKANAGPSGGHMANNPRPTRGAYTRASNRGAQLRPHGHHPAPAPGCVLSGQQCRAGPLSADGESLEEPHDHEQDRRPEPDAVGEQPERPGVVTGEQADEDRRDAHDQERP